MYSTDSSNGMIIDNTQTGTVNISGGTIDATGLKAALQNLNGTINISGGRLVAQNNSTVINQGTATISGSAYIQCSNYDKAAFFNFGGPVYITGGTLTNTVSGGFALYKQGGSVSLTGGSAVPNNL